MVGLEHFIPVNAIAAYNLKWRTNVLELDSWHAIDSQFQALHKNENLIW